MMTEIRIYCEGDPGLREGFHAFFTELREEGWRRRCHVTCFPRKANAIPDFLDAVRAYPQALCALLIDAEGSYEDRLKQPHPGLQEIPPESVFWMVQIMEAWFLADPEGLKGFYGRGFQESALKRNPRVEEIPKRDIIECLDHATRNCGKGQYGYNKLAHSNALLRRINPTVVRKAAPNCERLFDKIRHKLRTNELKPL